MSVTKEWQLQEAKNRLSEVVRLAKEAPQIITLRGEPQAVVLSFAEYRKSNRKVKDLVDALESAPEGFADLCQERNQDAMYREVDFG